MNVIKYKNKTKRVAYVLPPNLKKKKKKKICNNKKKFPIMFEKQTKTTSSVTDSVEDPGFLSRIPDPDFYLSRIQRQQQKRGVKKNLLPYLFL
jgi:hypothetical protein